MQLMYVFKCRDRFDSYLDAFETKNVTHFPYQNVLFFQNCPENDNNLYFFNRRSKLHQHQNKLNIAFRQFDAELMNKIKTR